MTSHFNRLLAAAAFTVAVTGTTGCKPANDSVAATAPGTTTIAVSNATAKPSATPAANISFSANDATLRFCTKDHHSVDIYMYAVFKPAFVNGVQINSTKEFFDGLEVALRDVFPRFPKAEFDENGPVTAARNYQDKILSEYMIQVIKNHTLENIDIVETIMSDEPTEECLRPTTPRITSAAPRL